MSTHLEASLQRDIDRIRAQVTEMGSLAGQSLKDCLQALLDNDPQLAYAIILRDQYVDQKEKEIDRLCLEFLLRQQPVAGTLRFVYSTIRISLELERVGDYAESIARQIVKLNQLAVAIPRDEMAEIANGAITMLAQSLRAFISQDAELARRTLAVEEKIDLLKSNLIKGFIGLHTQGKLPLEAIDPLSMIVRRFERVADQAQEICKETLYDCTGEYTKHPGTETFQVLFVDDTASGAAAIAEAIAHNLGEPKFEFASAGLDPRPMPATTAAFLRAKGCDPAALIPRSLQQVPNIDHFSLIVVLSPAVRRFFPRRPNKGILLEWIVEDPAKANASPEQNAAAHEAAYNALKGSITALVQAILKN